jgi:hypothetical protein
MKKTRQKPHTKPCCTKGQMRGLTKQSQEMGVKHEKRIRVRCKKITCNKLILELSTMQRVFKWKHH